MIIEPLEGFREQSRQFKTVELSILSRKIFKSLGCRNAYFACKKATDITEINLPKKGKLVPNESSDLHTRDN